jgi:PAS domain S-box-containing protein
MHALLLFAVGATLYAGIFHWTLARHLAPSRWLTGWAAVATAYLGVRAWQLSLTDPATAVIAVRTFASLGPILIWTMLRFALEIAGVPLSRMMRRALLVGALGFAAITLLTPWVMTDDVVVRRGLFGEKFLSARGAPASLMLAIAPFVALIWGLTAISRTSALVASERRVLSACLAFYAALAALSVLAGLQLVPLSGFAEFGPLVVAIGTTHLFANRERRLESDLESVVDRHTASLRASEERYRGLVEHAPIGVLVCNQNGDVMTLTRRVQEILGLDENAMQRPANLFRDAPRSTLPAVQALVAATAEGRTITREVPYRTDDGRRVDLKVVTAPQRAADGSANGALILIEDVTERRAVEARLRQSLKMETIGQLAGGIASGITKPMADVRENLAQMQQLFDALRKPLADDASQAGRLAEVEELLGESCEGVERAIAIVRDMRDLSQGGARGLESVDLNELLSGVVRMAATQLRGKAQIAERFGEIPSVTGNPGQLRQVFLNLIVNAVQAVGERGRIEISSASERSGVCVRVSDDGPGIASEHRDRLFVPFFTTKPAGEGTGLGLFISYQIVQSHGGELRLAAQRAPGTTFEVWLPVQRPAGSRAP